MNTTKFKIIVLFIVFAVITACSVDVDNGNCSSRYYAPTAGVQGPDSTKVNTPVTINVAYTIGNTCGAFDSFVENGASYPKTIGALINYTGCNCQQIPLTEVGHYTFTPPAVGVYELKFVTSDANAPIVKTITVTQ